VPLPHAAARRVYEEDGSFAESWIDEGIVEGQTLHLRVEADQAGERLDRYVTRSVATLSRSYARQLIEDGHIQVNEQGVKPSQPVRTGDVVTVYRPLHQPTDIVPEDIPLAVVYEDADIAVINKVAGMVVHPSPGHTSGTLVHALLARYPDLHIGGDIRPGIVHRLDLGTSGLIVIARHDEAMRLLKEQQKARTMHKAYLTVVEGPFQETSGLIDAPIGRHPTDRKRQAVVADGRSARTHYTIIEALGHYTLVEAVLETGRTHQIRVHFAHRQRPVLADPLYGPRRSRTAFGLTHQFLHAYKLGLYLPSSGEWREFLAPLPDDLAAVLEKLRRAVQIRET
jgi:23S rRNA pseudouridine1911/1915/1917 synthase